MSPPPPPSPEEIQLIEHLYLRVKEVLVHEEQGEGPYLIRWIRARENDLDKSENLLRSNLQWRKEKGVDGLLQRAQEQEDPWFIQNFPYRMDSKDKGGRPLVELPFGQWDIRKAMGGERERGFEDYLTTAFERVVASIKDSNDEGAKGLWPKVQQWTIIVDWNGYSYGQLLHWKALYSTLKLGSAYEAHYPELLHRAYFINCPKMFPLLMALLKRIINPKTMGKISWYGGEEEWRAVLLEEVGGDYGRNTSSS